MFFSKSFLQYTNELSKNIYNPLTKATERKLLEEYTAGSENAFNLLVKAHLRFVVYLLGSYKVPQFMNAMDLIQEGNIGFIVSLPKFDINKCDCRIATYSQYWIRFYINKALTIRSKASKTISYTDNMSMFEETIKYDLDDSETLHMTIQQHVSATILSDVLSILDKKDAKILSLLLGLEPPHTVYTLKEVGSMVHLHAERVRQIKEKSLKKLKELEGIETSPLSI